MPAENEVVTGGVIMDDTAMTGITTYNSNPVRIDRCHVCSLDVLTTSGTDTAAGTFAVQVCNDIDVASPNWVAVAFTDGTSTVTSVSFDLSSAELQKFFNMENLGAKYLRAQVVTTAGGASDTIRVVAHVKNRG
jgi:hypothetical protein